MATNDAGKSGGKEAFNRQVQRAFAVGWRVVELYYLPQNVLDPTISPEPFAPVRDLDFAMRSQLLVGQICTDLDWIGVDSPAGLRAVGAIGRSANPGADRLVRVDSIELPRLFHSDVLDVKKTAPAIHQAVQAQLTVKSSELGKAYAVGVVLARAVLAAYQELQLVLDSAQAEMDPLIALRRVKESVAKDFTERVVLEQWAAIKDLESRFPPFAADAIAAGLLDWFKWAGEGRTRRGQPSASEQVDTVSYRLRRQAQVWYSLLSGEREPTDILLTINYIDGAISLIRHSSSIFVRVIGANMATLLVAFVAVGSMAFALQKFSNSTSSWIFAYLIALGGFAAGAVAGSRSFLAKAGDALWNAELLGAIAVAINYVPALPYESEVERLRDINPRPRRPADRRRRQKQ